MENLGFCDGRIRKSANNGLRDCSVTRYKFENYADRQQQVTLFLKTFRISLKFIFPTYIRRYPLLYEISFCLQEESKARILL